MNPKEKALQLFNNYFDYVEAFTSNQQNDNAKKCALILINEIIKMNPKLIFWQDVKTEIEKI